MIGKDSFGQFGTCTARCSVCEEPNHIVLQYIGDLKLPPGIAVEATILEEKDRGIGITCGCYAKFHRQVAHIEDKINQRAAKFHGRER